MRIATWNINSVTARLDRLTAWLEEAQPDVVALQDVFVMRVFGCRFVAIMIVDASGGAVKMGFVAVAYAEDLVVRVA